MCDHFHRCQIGGRISRHFTVRIYARRYAPSRLPALSARLDPRPALRERESGGCCGLMGLLEFLLLARLQSPGNVHIYPCVGPQATMKDLMHPTHLGLHRRGGSRHVDIEACRMKLFHSKKYLGYCRAKSIVMMIR